MSLGDCWFIDFDKFTLNDKLQGVNFGIYGSTEREMVPNDLNKIEFSLVKFESSLMRHFVAQFTSLYNFFSTESTANEHSYFQRYARKMLNYMKAELNYCFTFWQNEKMMDYVGHRLSATLLRTYYFLLDLHMNVFKKIPDGNKTYWTSQDSLDDLSEQLAVKYQDLVALIQVFEKLFEELYNKMSPLARLYPHEVDLIVTIWTISNIYFSYSYDDIKNVASAKFPFEEENKLKEKILMSNEMFRIRAEAAKNQTSEEALQERKEHLTTEMYKSQIVNKISQDFDKDSYYLVNKALNNMRENAVRYETEEDYLATRTKGNFLERLRQNAKASTVKKSIPKRISDYDGLLLSSISPQKGLTLMQLNSVKESPNNPLARNKIIHSLISDVADEHNFLVKVTKETSAPVDRKGRVSHFTNDLLSKLELDAKGSTNAPSSDSETFVPPNKKNVTSKVEIDEDEYLRIMNQKLGDFMTARSHTDASDESFLQKRRGIFKSIQILNPGSHPFGDPSKMLKEAESADKDKAAKDGSDSNDSDDEKKKKKKDKAFKKKYGVKEEELQRMIAEAESVVQQQQSKENKGDDIPDEVVLGDLMGIIFENYCLFLFPFSFL